MIKRRKGFTLIELVIVIAVIAILAAILIPTFMSVANNAKFSADVQSARNMSMITKTAAINGATDSEGKPLSVNVNEPNGVVTLLKANGYSLTPKSKDSAFWYNRATGDVEIVKDAEMFDAKNNVNVGGTAKAKPLQARAETEETTFTQDCLEALIPAMPSYVFINQSDKHPVTRAISAIYSLAPDEQSAENQTFEAIGAKMKSTFDESVKNNDELKKLFNINKDNGDKASLAYTHLLEFSPESCYYVTGHSAYTAQLATNGWNFERILFSPDALNFSKPKIATMPSMSFANPINIPMSIVTFAEGCMTTIDQQNVVVVNRNYTSFELLGSGCSAIVVNNAGKIQITYLNLKYDAFTYNQYGIKYNNYTKGEDGAEATNYMSLFSQLGELSGQKPLDSLYETLNGTGGGYGVGNVAEGAYKKIQSIYAVPYVSILSKVNGNQDITLKLLDENNKLNYDVKVFSKNVANLTVIYGSIVAKDVVYKIQDIAYIKSVSTHQVTLDGTNYFSVRDPLAGSYYYNLEGIKVFAMTDSDANWREMDAVTVGGSKGDFRILKNGNEQFSKVQIQDKSGNVILEQYV